MCGTFIFRLRTDKLQHARIKNTKIPRNWTGPPDTGIKSTEPSPIFFTFSAQPFAEPRGAEGAQDVADGQRIQMDTPQPKELGLDFSKKKI